MKQIFRWKTGRIAFSLASSLALFLVLAASAQSTRTVHGSVVDNGGKAIQGAVVQMKDVQSLMVRSFITQDDGTFQFGGLNPDIDYELRAHLGSQWSNKKTVSRFDSKAKVEVVLTIAGRTT